MKKVIITALLALVALTGLAKAKTIVWEKPAVGYSDVPYFAIQKVELTKERTALFVNMRLLPGYHFWISKGSQLQADGRQYDIIGSDSIELDSRVVMDESGQKNFILYFKPLPMDTKEFDFIDGMTDNDYRVFGIHDKDYTMPAAPVPAEYQADYAEEDQWAELKYGDEPATIHFKAVNYRKGMRPTIQVQYVDLKNPATSAVLELQLNDDGEGSISFPIGLPQIVSAVIDNQHWSSYEFVYLAPGKEVTLLVDMLHDDTYTNSKFVGRKGYFAKFDKEWTQAMIDIALGNGLQPTLPALKDVAFTDDFVQASRDYVQTDAEGYNADLARYCHYLPQVLNGKTVEKPRIADPTLSALYDKYAAKYRQTIATQKEGLASNVHYLDMTEVAPDSILQTILDKYKGKTVLVDIWATWCAPCKVGHEKMKPLKEELKDKGIVYVYIVSPTSSYDKWKKYIADIPGEHYFLTAEQERSIMKQYGTSGIPAYAVYAPNGQKVYSQSGFSGIERIKEALEKARLLEKLK